MKFKWKLLLEFERYKRNQKKYEQDEGSGEIVGFVCWWC